MGGWVYIMTNRPNGILYTGVTSDLARRAWEHREGLVKGFTQRYGLKRLVYTEFFEDIRDAIQREKNMKHYSRAWKGRRDLGDQPGLAGFVRGPQQVIGAHGGWNVILTGLEVQENFASSRRLEGRSRGAGTDFPAVDLGPTWMTATRARS
jgi:putative endonuclease